MTNTTPDQTGAGIAQAALIVGIIAIASAFVPYLNNIAWAIGLAGVVVAMIALNKSANKKLPMIGLLLSLFAGGVGLFMSGVYATIL